MSAPIKGILPAPHDAEYVDSRIAVAESVPKEPGVYVVHIEGGGIFRIKHDAPLNVAPLNGKDVRVYGVTHLRQCDQSSARGMALLDGPYPTWFYFYRAPLFGSPWADPHYVEGKVERVEQPANEEYFVVMVASMGELVIHRNNIRVNEPAPVPKVGADARTWLANENTTGGLGSIVRGFYCGGHLYRYETETERCRQLLKDQGKRLEEVKRERDGAMKREEKTAENRLILQSELAIKRTQAANLSRHLDQANLKLYGGPKKPSPQKGKTFRGHLLVEKDKHYFCRDAPTGEVPGRRVYSFLLEVDHESGGIFLGPTASVVEGSVQPEPIYTKDDLKRAGIDLDKVDVRYNPRATKEWAQYVNEDVATPASSSSQEGTFVGTDPAVLGSERTMYTTFRREPDGSLTHVETVPAPMCGEFDRRFRCTRNVHPGDPVHVSRDHGGMVVHEWGGKVDG